MISFISLCVLIYGLSKLVKFAKDNPATSIKAAKCVKHLLSR
jgi:hypothetical protein